MQRSLTKSASLVGLAILLLAVTIALVGPACSKDKAGGGEQGTAATAPGSGALVAKVDGKAITEDMVGKETRRVTAAMSAQMDPQQIASMGGAMRKQAIENMISRILLEQAANKEGVTVAREQVTARMDEIKKSFPSEQAFTDRIATMGMTPVELEQEIETGMRFEALLAKHAGEAKPPTDDQIKAFYDENRTQFQQPERVRASHILVTVAKEDTDAQKAEKRAKAEQILADLKGGADFAKTATEKSDCPSKQQGGDLGYFGKGQMVPPFEAAAFSLKVGQLSDIVQTDFGYHIIKVAEHQAAHDVPLDEAKPRIVSYLEGQQRDAGAGTYIQSLRASAKIEYADTTAGK
ncbi:MAG: peptidylprolyl isomerase [bacterium]